MLQGNCQCLQLRDLILQPTAGVALDATLQGQL
jgi:hypothetical protein